MDYSAFNSNQTAAVIALFTQVFTDSEGETEGKSIGALVSNLVSTTPKADLIGYVASENEQLLGAIFFSRLTIANGDSAFMLSPVAVATAAHSKGIGQQLINYGLAQLKAAGVRIALTYGDPNYYSKTGFKPISEDIIQAPQPLSQAEGWLAQSLDGGQLKRWAGQVIVWQPLIIKTIGRVLH